MQLLAVVNNPGTLAFFCFILGPECRRSSIQQDLTPSSSCLHVFMSCLDSLLIVSTVKNNNNKITSCTEPNFSVSRILMEVSEQMDLKLAAWLNVVFSHSKRNVKKDV